MRARVLAALAERLARAERERPAAGPPGPGASAAEWRHYIFGTPFTAAEWEAARVLVEAHRRERAGASEATRHE